MRFVEQFWKHFLWYWYFLGLRLTDSYVLNQIPNIAVPLFSDVLFIIVKAGVFVSVHAYVCLWVGVCVCGWVWERERKRVCEWYTHSHTLIIVIETLHEKYKSFALDTFSWSTEETSSSSKMVENIFINNRVGSCLTRKKI